MIHQKKGQAKPRKAPLKTIEVLFNKFESITKRTDQMLNTEILDER